MNSQLAEQEPETDSIKLPDGTVLAIKYRQNDVAKWIKLITVDSVSRGEFFGFYGDPLDRYKTAEEVLAAAKECQYLSDLNLLQNNSVFSDILNFPGGRVVTIAENPKRFPITMGMENDKRQGQMFQITKELYWELYDYIVNEVVTYDSVFEWLVNHGLINVEN